MVPFELVLSTGPARGLHRRDLGRIADAMPWGTIDRSRYPRELLEKARLSWTVAAVNEHSTAVVMTQLLEALLRARAPVDLWALVSRFITDEVLHVELASRLAEELGGGVPLEVDTDAICPSRTDGDPLEVAAELVVTLCCVGEVFSVAMLRGCARDAAHPLTRAVLRRIADDEALHGVFGWMFLEWAAPRLGEARRRELAGHAARAIRSYEPIWRRRGLPPGPRDEDARTPEGFLVRHVHELGWLEAGDYARLAERTLRRKVIAPLARHGIVVS